MKNTEQAKAQFLEECKSKRLEPVSCFLDDRMLEAIAAATDEDFPIYAIIYRWLSEHRDSIEMAGVDFDAIPAISLLGEVLDLRDMDIDPLELH